MEKLTLTFFFFSVCVCAKKDLLLVTATVGVLTLLQHYCPVSNFFFGFSKVKENLLTLAFDYEL